MWFLNFLPGRAHGAAATTPKMWTQCAHARAMVARCADAGGEPGAGGGADSRLEVLRRRGWSTIRAVDPVAGAAG